MSKSGFVVGEEVSLDSPWANSIEAYSIVRCSRGNLVKDTQTKTSAVHVSPSISCPTIERQVVQSVLLNSYIHSYVVL